MPQRPHDLPRYKTEFCRTWQENHNCKYGDKCQVIYLLRCALSVAVLVSHRRRMQRNHRASFRRADECVGDSALCIMAPFVSLLLSFCPLHVGPGRIFVGGSVTLRGGHGGTHLCPHRGGEGVLSLSVPAMVAPFYYRCIKRHPSSRE